MGTSHVYYKFSAVLDYEALTFNGLHISLRELKYKIRARKKLKATKCDLLVTNAQTKEEYTEDNALIPKNSSVIVRRVPAGGVKATSKTYDVTPESQKILQSASRSGTEPASGTSKAIDDSSARVAQLVKAANLAETDASEEEKIKAMMIQSCQAYNPVNFMKKNSGRPPPSYTCFRCGQPGHYIKNCPTNRDKNFQPVPRMKKSTGIPRSFLMEVKDPNTKGAMLTNTGKYVIPTINAEAYARGKKEKPPFVPAEPPSSSSCSDEDLVPAELLCPICKDVTNDAAVIPCCGNSFCDECIRTALLESEEHTCPMCHQTDVSPDSLVANKILRQAVNNFRNGTGYSKQIQQQQQLPPPAVRQTVTRNPQPLLRPTISKQKDPLIPPSASVSSHSAALSSFGPTQASGAAQLPGILPSVTVPGVPAAVSLPFPGPFREADVVTAPAALVAAAGLSKPSSLTSSGLWEEQGYQVPILRQPALTSLLGPQGQSIPTNGQPVRASTVCSASGRPGWELEIKKSELDEFTNDFAKELMEYKRLQKEHRALLSRSRSPHGASSHSRSSYTCSKSRSGSSHSRTNSGSFSHSQPRSHSRSPPRQRRGRANSRDRRSSPRSRRHYRSRSRSCRRCRSRSRSPVFRGQSHTKRTVPQWQGEREHFNRHAEGPASSMKGSYGRPVDVRDPFETERCREWERNYREWYGKFYKGCAVGAQPPPAVNREKFSPERFGPPGARQENSPCAWGNREDYPGGQSHRSHNITGHYGEKPSGRERPGISDPRKSKEKEVKHPWGDDKGNKHKRHQKRRKCNENEGFRRAELLEGARTPREPVPAGDNKTDSVFMLPSSGDATPVRDEPVEADLIAFKPVSEEERTEKDEPKEKNKTELKVEVAAPPKKDDTIIAAKTSQETVNTDCENSPVMEPPVKKVKKELSKTDDAVISSSQKDEKAPDAPRKYHPEVTKDQPGTRTAKDEKVKKDHPKETKAEKPSREDKSEKPAGKSKSSDAKPEKGKGNADEKVGEEHEAASTDASKPETAEWKPSAKGKSEPDAGKGEETPETDKSAFLNHPAKEMELNQETGENLVRGENVPPAEDPAGKPKASSSKVKQDKAKGKVRVRATAVDGSGSVLVGYTSSSSTEGRPRTKTEEKPDTKQTVIKTMEEYNNDLTAPAEDVILTIQVSQSKWDKDEFEAGEEHIESTQVPTNRIGICEHVT
ncbi:E3 ubiquitin-protein ligase RBBP6-like isoform X1 [Patagioenas fasciata]|uniref:E3 ubiquitin-protein ligase RBBP6-like isoform X1 n=1 Tax=Patagioenas fasciata TaxID=372321 RepID=UPI003A9921E5